MSQSSNRSMAKTRSPIFGEVNTPQAQSIIQPYRPIESLQQKISPQNRQLPLRCHYHPDQFIHNFCKNQICLLPLCPACVSIHLQDHQEQSALGQGQFEVLDSCIQEQQQKLAQQCAKYQEVITDIDQLKTEIKNAKELQKSKLIEAKAQILQLVENYFSKFGASSNETNNKHRELYEKWDSYNKSLQKLETDQCLKTLIKCYRTDYDQVLQQQFDGLQHFKSDIKTRFTGLQLDNSQLDIFNAILPKYAYIGQSPDVAKQQTLTPQPIQILQQKPQPQPLPHQSSPPRVLQGFPIYQSSPINQLKGLPQQFVPQQIPFPQQFQSGIQQFPFVSNQQMPTSSPIIKGKITSEELQKLIQSGQIQTQLPFPNLQQTIQPPFIDAQTPIFKVPQQAFGFQDPLKSLPLNHSFAQSSSQGQVIQLKDQNFKNSQFNPDSIKFPRSTPYLNDENKFEQSRQQKYDFSPKIDLG
ncbi:hypothetical protein pb186bvf_012792 [Paramecium bursaria]